MYPTIEKDFQGFLCALKQLQALKTLPPNWDSYGSPVIDPDCLNVAELLLRALKGYQSPQVLPVSGGGVNLEWDSQERFLSLSIRRETHGLPVVEYSYGNETYPEAWEEGDLCSIDILRLLSQPGALL